MSRYTDRQKRRAGLGTLVVLVLLAALAFNLQHLPGMSGTRYEAEFSDASGLHTGARVEIAGIRVGRVDSIRIEGDKVIVGFDVMNRRLGTQTQASIEVLNLIGEKYLNLTPRGEGTLASGGRIPLAQTKAGYDIVSTLGRLTTTEEGIDTPQLATALTTLAGTLDQAQPEIRGSFDGIARLSRTVASRDRDIERLLRHADDVVKLIDERKGDLVGLMKQGDQIFAELVKRRDAIHQLLVSARTLATQLAGLVRDNREQIGPALRELQTAVTFLNQRERQLGETIKNYGPYASVLINIIGTGPWFDAYVPNFAGLATGEFRPGFRPGMK